MHLCKFSNVEVEKGDLKNQQQQPQQQQQPRSSSKKVR